MVNQPINPFIIIRRYPHYVNGTKISHFESVGSKPKIIGVLIWKMVLHLNQLNHENTFFQNLSLVLPEFYPFLKMITSVVKPTHQYAIFGWYCYLIKKNGSNIQHIANFHLIRSLFLALCFDSNYSNELYLFYIQKNMIKILNRFSTSKVFQPQHIHNFLLHAANEPNSLAKVTEKFANQGIQMTYIKSKLHNTFKGQQRYEI